MQSYLGGLLSRLRPRHRVSFLKRGFLASSFDATAFVEALNLFRFDKRIARDAIVKQTTRGG